MRTSQNGLMALRIRAPAGMAYVLLDQFGYQPQACE